MTVQRITEGYTNHSVLSNLVSNRDLLMDIQRKIASAKEINRASEDVFSATTILNSNSTLGKIETFFKNINSARSEIETADQAVLTSLDSIHQVKELTIQALNATSGPAELNIIGSQVEQLVEQVKDLANTKYGSKFVFGGQNTSTPPFVQGMFPEEIEYRGSTDGSFERTIEIAESVSINVNMGGDDIFGYHYTSNDNGTPADRTDDTVESKGLLSTLITLKEELQKPAPDKDVIRDKLSALEDDLATLLKAQSSLGGLLTRLDITQNIHEGDKINLTEAKSKAQDVDMAKAVSDLSFQETALKASLQVSARIIQPSLMNFL